MTDYYMGFIAAGPYFDSRDHWNYRIRSLGIGEGFTVATAYERKCILKRARRMNVMVSTAKLKDGGYSIKRIKDAPARKPGQPPKWGKLNDLL